jgi:hypothetical protein
MEREAIALATKLLDKAQSTKFDAESAALTARAYRLLADALNAYDDQAASAGVARRRERRHLRDRRASAGSSASSAPRTGGPGSCGSRAGEPTAPPGRRGNWIDPPRQGLVDLRV